MTNSRARSVGLPAIVALAAVLTGSVAANRRGQAGGQPVAVKRPNIRVRHRRRLVDPARGRLGGSDGQHARVRSDRAGGRPVHPRVHGCAVVHAVARGAPDRSGRTPPGRRRQPAWLPSERICRLSRPPRAGRIHGGTRRQGLGARQDRACRAAQAQGRTAATESVEHDVVLVAAGLDNALLAFVE